MSAVIAMPLGRPRTHHRLTTSTNDRARELAERGAPHGTLVTAAEQSRGRGRQGRRWSAPADSSVLMSVLLRQPDEQPGDRQQAGGATAGDPVARPPTWPPPLLTIAAGIAVCDVVGERAQIKWPNDVVFRDGERLTKVGGILAEGRPQERWVVLGIGLNVALDLATLDPDLRDRAATMGRPASEIEPTLQALLRSLERRLDDDPETILARWPAIDALFHSQVSHPHGCGRAEGIDAGGRLIVSDDHDRRTALDAGEVHLSLNG